MRRNDARESFFLETQDVRRISGMNKRFSVIRLLVSSFAFYFLSPPTYTYQENFACFVHKTRPTRKIDHSWEIGEAIFICFFYVRSCCHTFEEEIRDGNSTSIYHLTMNSEKQRMQRLKSCE